MVADSGVLLASVCSVKDYGSRKYIGLDTGYNHFPRCFLYGAWHKITNLSRETEKKAQYDVTGYLCQSGDVFCRERKMSETHVGDVLCISDVGAYGYSMSSNFNLRVRPAELMLLSDNTIKEIRRAETVDDLLRTCSFEF
jgi:diaminopimelate decarboxylase